VAQDDAGGRPPLIERIRARQAQHRERTRIFRVAFAVAGFAVLLLGVVMLFTPGPGWAVIVIGLGMLALEFAWAERLLERVIDQMERAADQVTKGSPARRAALIAVGVLVLAGIVTIIVVWDLPFLPG
jgi:uncharacterized protein (TIGR02611 family)